MNKINEIFYSLQGEGYYTGHAAIFIRYSGCNLKCSFCDTSHENYTIMSDKMIYQTLIKYPSSFVVLTGGEPSLQISEDLVSMLHKNNFYITIETNGTHTFSNNIDWITLSPKEGHNIVIERADEIKIVYQGQNVETWIAKGKLLGAKHFYLQPCSGKNIPETVAYILNHPWWNLSLQTHKIIGIN